LQKRLNEIREPGRKSGDPRTSCGKTAKTVGGWRGAHASRGRFRAAHAPDAGRVSLFTGQSNWPADESAGAGTNRFLGPKSVATGTCRASSAETVPTVRVGRPNGGIAVMHGPAARFTAAALTRPLVSVFLFAWGLLIASAGTVPRRPLDGTGTNPRGPNHVTALDRGWRLRIGAQGLAGQRKFSFDKTGHPRMLFLAAAWPGRIFFFCLARHMQQGGFPGACYPRSRLRIMLS